jgi:hypothetical protein
MIGGKGHFKPILAKLAFREYAAGVVDEYIDRV